MTRRRPWCCGLVLALVLTLAACASAPEPFDYQPANDLKPGPGLFTGQEGMWTIVGPSQPALSQTPTGAKTGEDGKVAPEAKPERPGGTQSPKPVVE